jgi:hypothetical protein
MQLIITVLKDEASTANIFLKKKKGKDIPVTGRGGP